MNRTQAALWDLAAQDPWTPIPTIATETTDGLCLLAFMGRDLFSLMEKLTTLDLAAPSQTALYLVQGPVLHIPTQAVVLNKGAFPVILMAFSRGYGQTMVHAVLEIGKNLGPPMGGKSRYSNMCSWSSPRSSASRFLMHSRIGFSSRPAVDTKYPLAQMISELFIKSLSAVVAVPCGVA